MKPQQRICIYTKDVMRITGKSERYSRKLIDKIKLVLLKEKHQCLSLQEFCKYMGLNNVEITLQ